jgi:hypothetical protein
MPKMILDMPTPAAQQRRMVLYELLRLYREQPGEGVFMERAQELLEAHDVGLVEIANNCYRQACEAVKMQAQSFIIDPKYFA